MPRPPGILRNFFDPEAIEREHLAFKLSMHLMAPAPPAPPEPAEDPSLTLLSQTEAAKRVGVRKERIAALMRSGKLPTVRVGQWEKVTLEALRALVASGDLNAAPRRGRPRKKKASTEPQEEMPIWPFE